MLHNVVEFTLGGYAACCAGFFTNPLEVVKTRMQLQGELQKRGKHAVHYKHVFHAFYTIARHDGIFALQKGLVPALWYQLGMNGIRLGLFQTLTNAGFTTDENGRTKPLRLIIAGAISGCTGAFMGSPLYMIKTHLQSRSNTDIAVGHQHEHISMTKGLKSIYRKGGIFGLWRGVDAAMCRVAVGSAAQLSTFSQVKDFLENKNVVEKGSLFGAFLASTVSGVVVVACMTPFDVISTRIYNQGRDPSGKGLLYTGVPDCGMKILKTEGIWGFYKGWAASLFRLGPHTVLSLVFWNESRKMYSKYVGEINL